MMDGLQTRRLRDLPQMKVLREDKAAAGATVQLSVTNHSGQPGSHDGQARRPLDDGYVHYYGDSVGCQILQPATPRSCPLFRPSSEGHRPAKTASAVGQCSGSRKRPRWHSLRDRPRHATSAAFEFDGGFRGQGHSPCPKASISVTRY